MYDIREAFSLDWDSCIMYASDNTNYMIGQRNSLFQKVRSVQGDQKISDVGCSCRLAHLFAGKAAK